MASEILVVSTPDDEGHKGGHQRGEDHVGYKHGEVQGAGPVVVGIGHRTYLNVVNQIRTEEERGADERGQHGLLVGLARAAADLQEAAHEQKRAQSVEAGV